MNLIHLTEVNLLYQWLDEHNGKPEVKEKIKCFIEKEMLGDVLYN